MKLPTHWTALWLVVLAAGVGVLAWHNRPRSASAPPEPAAVRAPEPKPILYSTDEALLTITDGGGSIGALKNLLRRASWPAPKDEVETTREFVTRSRAFNAPIGDYPRSSRFVIVLSANQFYNADKGEVELSAIPDGDVSPYAPLSTPRPVLLLASNATVGRSYVGTNAFGVARAIKPVLIRQTYLIPLGSLKAPQGCDFVNGYNAKSPIADLDTDSLVRWACGQEISSDEIEDVSSFRIPENKKDFLSLQTADVRAAYVVSFDGLPPGVSTITGPYTYQSQSPTLDNPVAIKVVGERIVGHLHRVVFYVPNGGIIFAKSYE